MKAEQVHAPLAVHCTYIILERVSCINSITAVSSQPAFACKLRAKPTSQEQVDAQKAPI